jgi:hypothetical protein
MNLYEKVGTTEPGKLAHMIGDLLYNHGTALNKGSDYIDKLHCPTKYVTWFKQLDVLRHYLEGLAHEQLKKEAEEEQKWVVQLAEKV